MNTRRLTMIVLTILTSLMPCYGQSTFVEYFVSQEKFQYLRASAQLNENVIIIGAIFDKDGSGSSSYSIVTLSENGEFTEIDENPNLTAHHDRIINIEGTDSAFVVIGEKPEGALLTDSIILGILGPSGELALSCGVDLGVRVDIGPNIMYDGVSYIVTRPAARSNTPILFKIENCEIVDSIEDFHPEFEQTLEYCDIRIFEDTIFVLSFLEQLGDISNVIHKFDLDLNPIGSILIDTLDRFDQFIGTRDKLRLLSPSNEEITLSAHTELPFDPTNPLIRLSPDQLVKITKSGTIISRKVLRGEELRRISNLELHPDGGYLGCGVATVAFYRDTVQQFAFAGWIFRLDDDLNIMWSKYIADSLNLDMSLPLMEFTEIYTTSDNGILAMGTVQLQGDNMPFANNPQIVAVKLDQNGTLNGEQDSIHFVDFLVSSRDIGGIEPEESPGVLIYPNPTKDFLNIELTDESRFSGYIQLTSMNGEILEQVDVEQRHQTLIDTSKYPPGMYVVSILDEQLGVVTSHLIMVQR